MTVDNAPPPAADAPQPAERATPTAPDTAVSGGSAATTVDQEARERLLTDLDRTFFVEAGAGTGKTTVLVGRIVNLVAAGRVQMEHLAAITFTEAAASELRDRVREELEKAASNHARAADERARCHAAIESIDLAAIQTIHAFAAGLLQAYPLEAGLPPGLTTLDDIEQDVLFDDQFRDWFWGDALQPPTHDAIRRALLLGLTQSHLRDLAALLSEQHDLLTYDTIWEVAPPLDAVAAAHEVGASLVEIESWLDRALDGPSDRLVQVVARAQPWARRLAVASTEEQALVALRGLGKLNASPGSQRRWGKLVDGANACTAIKQRLKEANDLIEPVLESHRAATFTRVLAALRDLTLAGVADRRAAGVATFHDLLTWARDLLRDHPEVRRRAQQRYHRIFVDEFQDTDPLQAEIVFYLAAAPDQTLPLHPPSTSDQPLAAHPAPTANQPPPLHPPATPNQPLPADWRDFRLVDGKLFIVGDPKQSIYRFRRADIGLYDDLLRRLPDGRLYLVQNFRSVRPLIEWVNHHFSDQMRAVVGIQPQYIDLDARREPFENGLPCGAYRVGQALEGNAAGVAATEAERLAALAHAAVEEGWLVSDRAADGRPVLRAARYGDICILLPARTHLRRLERTLEEASVPYRVESGKLVLATQEVRDLLAGLRAIEDPSDQVALVGALRSPAFGCSDPDLLRWVEGGGKLSYENPGDGPDGPVKDALRTLAEFHAARQIVSPPALIERYIADRLLVAAAFGEPRPRESWRRLRYVVSRARQFTATGRHTLRAFLDWIGGLERAEARDVESAEAEPDEDAVRILTIHNSKGLEFPIVLLAGLGSARGGGNGAVETIPDRQNGLLACRVGTEWRTTGYEDAQAREQQMAEAESVRLLYVATTRARDHLVLSLYRTSNAKGSRAALIEARLDAATSPDGTIDLCPVLPVPDVTTASWDSNAPIADLAIAEWGSEAFEQTWLARRHDLVEQFGAAPFIDYLRAASTVAPLHTTPAADLPQLDQAATPDAIPRRASPWERGHPGRPEPSRQDLDAPSVPTPPSAPHTSPSFPSSALDGYSGEWDQGTDFDGSPPLAGELDDGLGESTSLTGRDRSWKVRALVRRSYGGIVHASEDADPLVITQAQAILESQAVKEALASPTCRRSVPLLAKVDGTLLDLTADLVYETPDGMVLVTYLLADHPDLADTCSSAGGQPGDTGLHDSPDQARARQVAGLLCLAFTTATQLPVFAVDVVDARDGSTTRCADTAALAQEARAMLS